MRCYSQKVVLQPVELRGLAQRRKVRAAPVLVVPGWLRCHRIGVELDFAPGAAVRMEPVVCHPVGWPVSFSSSLKISILFMFTWVP